MGRTRESDSGRDKRPFTERWWWWFLVTAWAWFRMPELAYDLVKANPVEGFDWVASECSPCLCPCSCGCGGARSASV
jgi:hypothetical protein